MNKPVYVISHVDRAISGIAYVYVANRTRTGARRAMMREAQDEAATVRRNYGTATVRRLSPDCCEVMIGGHQSCALWCRIAVEPWHGSYEKLED